MKRRPSAKRASAPSAASGSRQRSRPEAFPPSGVYPPLVLRCLPRAARSLAAIRARRRRCRAGVAIVDLAEASRSSRRPRDMPVDVLAIAAHPDDIELACAGTLARLRLRGKSFGILDLTARRDGNSRHAGGPRPRGAARGRDSRRRRPREARLRRRRRRGPAATRSSPVIDVIRRDRPRIILTSYPEDRHPDHAPRRAGSSPTPRSTRGCASSRPRTRPTGRSR